MNVLERANQIRVLVTVALVVMALANIALAIALICEASSRKTVVVVPGVRTAREVAANEPPAEVVRDFVLLYLAHFDNYTPATVDEVTRYIEGWLSPRFYTQATNALARRKDLVGQSRMASQLLLPKRDDASVRHLDGSYEVSLAGLRRVYIADKLQSESTLIYTVVVEVGTPTLRNPYGLYVTGQLIAPKVEQNANEPQR